MIEVQDVVLDADMVSTEPWTILRSTATYSWGGVQSATISIPIVGPVRVASNRELQMLAEADKIGSIRAFYAAQPMYLTRGTQPVSVPYSETLQGSGTVYTVSAAPPGGFLCLTKNDAFQIPGIDYTLDGQTVTLFVATVPTDVLSASWLVPGQQSGLSDQIVYNAETYRLLQVYRTQGSGYWKAVATRENPS